MVCLYEERCASSKHKLVSVRAKADLWKGSEPCQGHDRKWRAAWNASCLFLIRDEASTSTGFVFLKLFIHDDAASESEAFPLNSCSENRPTNTPAHPHHRHVTHVSDMSHTRRAGGGRWAPGTEARWPTFLVLTDD